MSTAHPVLPTPLHVIACHTFPRGRCSEAACTLQANSVPFALARGRRALEEAIAQFRAAPDELAAETRARTLLLLVKQGANGLNLTGPAMPALPTSCHRCWIACVLHPVTEPAIISRMALY